MASRRKLGLAAVTSAAVGMTLLGCSDTLSLANLPDITKLPTKLLSKEEQAKTMNGMLEKGQTHQAEAAKEIEAVRIDNAAGLNAASLHTGQEGEKAR
ncbi:MAG TPA: hypothetical protein VFY92_11165 [Hyphomicrobiaceae bacterium]|nr:hypothetical protein [Hyphomicrobiaceae bacterium]